MRRNKKPIKKSNPVAKALRVNRPSIVASKKVYSRKGSLKVRHVEE